MSDINTQKSQARRAAKTRRAALSAPAAGPELIAHFPGGKFRGAIIAGFWPLSGEIDVRPLLRACHDAGHHLSLPCTSPVGNPLTFRTWTPIDTLKVGPYDTREPFASAPEITPQLVFVPLLAFSPSGKRLGYGGGYYDRTLAGLRERGEVFACGVAYTGQEISDIPTDEYDQSLDGILTESYFKTFA